ncbi:hypothetical protein C4D60_Mb07t19640 [Musa balbisiana]|uniref:Uncharacterized protein n=1 Tax=Musa balbisiana TaxID=52838 RepID=A0A4S8JJ08_MUSBA|nr:hypothetical protein C4D60_Mb07t19640 [Musa balbisiana]
MSQKNHTAPVEAAQLLLFHIEVNFQQEKLSVFPNCTAVPEIYRFEEVSLRLDMGLREPLTSAGVDESRQWPGWDA